jgi:hypothetical protein
MMASSSKRIPPPLPVLAVSSRRMAIPAMPSSDDFGIEIYATAVPKIA